MKKTKGIILAGGSGSRLYPMTTLYSKQLVIVYDKPLIYYPLSTLMLSGIRDILIITNKNSIKYFKILLGNGKHLGMNIKYKIQERPDGIAQALILGEEFIKNDNVVLILGDNIFYGDLSFLRNAIKNNKYATIFGYYVNNPERYGVIEYKNNKPIRIIEKPNRPISHYAVPGIYIYDNTCSKKARSLKPSKRKELEITDLNNLYLKEKKLNVIKMSRGIAWLDTGTPESLLEASNFIGTIEARQNLKIGCIEEIAYRMNYINKKELKHIIKNFPHCNYKNYLKRIIENE